jgi:uncharacterized protein with FMN-binding domain
MRSRSLTTAGLGVAAAAVFTPAVVPATAAARTYKGKLERSYYSNVQVSITVTGKKIKSLSVTADPQGQESYRREAYALPILRTEALRAQTYRIHTISGVTITSEAFILSLYSAMGHANLK